ncbi:peptidase A4 family-domain-containing protein [Aspergillus californicus]
MAPLILNLILLTTILQIPILTQAASSRSPRLLNRLENHTYTHSSFHASLGETLHPQQNTYYTDNWAGAVLLASDQPNAPSFTSVAATLTVPLSTPSSTHVQAASAWVGIDGFGNTDSILQTGIDIVAYTGANTDKGTEVHEYTAWYE